MEVTERLQYQRAIDEICELDWQGLTSQDMISVAWAYYYFSIQFRENLQIARALYPDDDKLKHLEREECYTDNLSPWPGVAAIDEKMNHDEYMRRTLDLLPIEEARTQYLSSVGEEYLANIRKVDKLSRALSITSYEDGGLERVFRAILEYDHWNNGLLRSFEHFLAEHVRFDSDPDQGHGALSRHLKPDDRVLPLWEAFKDILVTCVPRLAA
jgi:hypothetical protein